MVVIAAGVMWAGLSAGASADNDWVEFGEQSVETNFPEDMVFSLEFSTDRSVSRVNLTFLIVGQDSRRVEPVDFEEGNPSIAEFTLRTRGGSSTYIPPGAVISYRWILEDEDGNSAETEVTEFVYTDTRFEWNTVTRENVTVYYNGPVQTRAETVLDTSVETLSNMGRLLETSLTRNINIVMYNNPVQMKDALPFISRTSSSGLVTQGQAHGKEGVLLINGFDSQIKGIVSHEVTHLLIAQAAEGPGKRVPDWLNEGLAEYGNIEPGFSYDLAVLRAVQDGHPLPPGPACQSARRAGCCYRVLRPLPSGCGLYDKDLRDGKDERAPQGVSGGPAQFRGHPGEGLWNRPDHSRQHVEGELRCASGVDGEDRQPARFDDTHPHPHPGPSGRSYGDAFSRLDRRDRD